MNRVPENRSFPGLTFFITTNLEPRLPLFRKPEFANLVLDTLAFYRNNGQITLYGFVIMHDHIHLLIQTNPPMTISKWMDQFKTWIARKLERGSIWQSGYWSEVIDGDFFARQKLNYIHQNPVRNNLVRTEQDYFYSSAPDYFGSIIPPRVSLVFGEEAISPPAGTGDGASQ